MFIRSKDKTKTKQRENILHVTPLKPILSLIQNSLSYMFCFLCIMTIHCIPFYFIHCFYPQLLEAWDYILYSFHATHSSITTQKTHRTWLQTAHLNREAENLNTHSAHIRSRHLPHQAGKLISVLVNLLHCQGA